MNRILTLVVLLVLAACHSTPANQPASQKADSPSAPLANTQAVPADSAIRFDTYCNARFGYCIGYPKGILYPQPESYNGDGCVLKNKTGESILTVWGRLNQDAEGNPITLAQQYDDDLHGSMEAEGKTERVVTYQKLGKSFFVISGYRGGNIFYQKTIVKGDAFAFALLEYKESEKALYNNVSDSVFASFQ